MNSKGTLQTFQLGVLALALGVVVGCGSSGSGGSGGPLVDVQQMQRDDIVAIQKIQTDIAAKKKVTKWEVSAKDIQDDPRAKDMKLADQQGQQRIQQALTTDFDDLPALKDFSGYKKIDFKNPDERLKKYATNKRQPEGSNPQMPATGFEPFIDRYKDSKIVVLDLKVTTTQPAPPVEKGKPTPPPVKNTMEITFGPIDEKEADKLIDSAKKQGTEVEKVKSYPANFYIGPKGKVAIGIEGLKSAARLSPPRDIQYYMIDVDTLKKLEEARKKDATLAFIQPKMFDIAVVGYKK